MGLSRTVSDINGDFSRNLLIFSHPVYLTPPQINMLTLYSIGHTWMFSVHRLQRLYIGYRYMLYVHIRKHCLIQAQVIYV